MVLRICIWALLASLVGQSTAFGNSSNIYDISPESLKEFETSTREKQEQMLVAELEDRISSEIRRAAKKRLLRHTAVVLTAIGTMVLAYKLDVKGSLMEKYDEWRGNLVALATRHIQNDGVAAYDFITRVNSGAGIARQVNEEMLKEYFAKGVNPTQLLTTDGQQACIEFVTEGEKLVIPEHYWPGIVLMLRGSGVELPDKIEFPEPSSEVAAGFARAGSAATRLAGDRAQATTGEATVNAAVGAFGVVTQWAGNWWVKEGRRDAHVDISKIADALRGRNRIARLAETAQKALTSAAVSVAAVWNWKEVLGIGATLIGTGIKFYDRVVLPVLPRLYEVGRYAAGFPFMVHDDYILAFHHVTYSPLIVDEREYIKLRHLMYPPLVARVDQVLTDANDGKVSVSEASQFVRYALRLPLTEKFIRYDRRNVRKSFDDFFSYYSAGTRQVFQQILESALAENILVGDSEQSGIEHTSTLNRHVFLHGPHGVGKTYGVSGFANIIGQPIGRSQLHASDQVQNEGSAFGQKNATPGRIALGLMQQVSSYRYHTLWSVVFYDEADASLNSPRLAEYWKATLDPNGDGVYLPYFGVTFPWPHNVFFVGNQKIGDPALVSRMDIGELQPYNENQKANILIERIVPRMLRKDFGTVDFQTGTVRKGPGSAESYEFSSLPEKLQKEILDLVGQHSDDPGMRKIEAATKGALGRYRLYNIP